MPPVCVLEMAAFVNKKKRGCLIIFFLHLKNSAMHNYYNMRYIMSQRPLKPKVHFITFKNSLTSEKGSLEFFIWSFVKEI